MTARIRHVRLRVQHVHFDEIAKLFVQQLELLQLLFECAQRVLCLLPAACAELRVLLQGGIRPLLNQLAELVGMNQLQPCVEGWITAQFFKGRAQWGGQMLVEGGGHENAVRGGEVSVGTVLDYRTSRTNSPGEIMFSVILSLFACSEKSLEEEEPASRMPYCEEVETAFELSEVSPMGISMAEFTDQLAESYTVITQGDEPECLLASLSLDSESVRYVESNVVTPEGDGPVPTIAVECYDYLAIDASISVSSDSGISEQHDIELQVSELQAAEDGPLIASFRSDIDAPQSLSLDGLEDATFSIYGEVGESVFSGRIDALVVEESGSTVTAMHEELLSWAIPAGGECDSAE